MADKFLGEAGVEQLIHEVQTRYDKIDSYMVLDPSDKAKCRQILLSYVVAPVYAPILFIKDVRVDMVSLIGVGSDVLFIKSPGTVSPIIMYNDVVKLDFGVDDLTNLCDAFPSAVAGDVLITKKYCTTNTTVSTTAVLFKETQMIITKISRELNSGNDFDAVLNQKIEETGADSGVLLENFNYELIKAGNVVQIENALFSITYINKDKPASGYQLNPLEITAAEVTEKFNS